ETPDPKFAAERQDTNYLLDFLGRFVRARKRAKLSQADVAILMGTSQSAISEMEKGAVEPRLSTLQRYARILGMRLRLGLEASPYEDRTFHYPRRPVRFKANRELEAGSDKDREELRIIRI